MSPLVKLAALTVFTSVLVMAGVFHVRGDDAATALMLMILSSGLAGASVVPYLYGIVSGQVRPRLVTWATWSVLTGMAATASASSGDWPAATLAGVGTAATAMIVATGWRAGVCDIGRFDLACALLVAAGLGIWWYTDNPAAAVVVACLVDLIGLAPTLAHVWAHAQEESTSAFALIAAGGLCSVLAAWGTWTITAMAYPVYVTASTAAVAALTLRRVSQTPIEPELATAKARQG